MRRHGRTSIPKRANAGGVHYRTGSIRRDRGTHASSQSVAMLSPVLNGPLFPITAASDARYRNASPFSLATAPSPPTIPFHGDADPRVPIELAASLVIQLATTACSLRRVKLSPFALAALAAAIAGQSVAAQAPPPLPFAVSNNAVAAGRIGETTWLFSALGIDHTKRWSGITRAAVAWRPGARTWQRLPDVPGPVGRLAATAQVVRGKLVIFGGYTVDSAGHEASLPSVDVFDVLTKRWSRGADMPVAVDDAVSGVYRDSLVYLVSGWHDTDNVRDVQVYDVVRDEWHAATPIPGPGVFGHSGALAGHTIVYIDGALRQPTGARYRLERQTWSGTIDTTNPRHLEWTKAPRAHPGPALYRAAAAACGTRVVFAGGTDNPYNYDGIGYDSVPSQPRREVFAFDVKTRRWIGLPRLSTATMDHRALATVDGASMVVGGMREGRRVSDRTVLAPRVRCGK